jgi:hypothetical protein
MKFPPLTDAHRRLPAAAWIVAALYFGSVEAEAQSIALPWSGHGHDPQHTAISQVASQPLNRIIWQAPVDLPNTTNATLYIHYGSPLITRQNTIIFPVKTSAAGDFKIEARSGADGTLLWMQPTDYMLPQHGWTPPCAPALTPKNRLWFPGAGGTVYFRDAPDAAAGNSGQVAFYGLANYQMDSANFDANVRISTPITSDRYGNIFFGFEVYGTTTPALQSGLARIAEDGACSWIAASAAAEDGGIAKVVLNCAPALSNDHRTLYFAVSAGNFSGGYLVALDSRTLAPKSKVRLRDVLDPNVDARLLDDGTASPTVGPDGDVYFGVFENTWGANHYRGWLRHFDATLAQTKTPGAFGWDQTASIVPASLVADYHGSSPYLLLSKYNDYVGSGSGRNKVAILDPNDAMIDPQTGATVMKEILTVLGPTPDDEYPEVEGAVREWCINTVAIDVVNKCACIHSEDGKIYRWDFTTNTLLQPLTLTPGIGEAYTPSVIGVDGTVYVIANAILFAVGQ